MIDTRHALLIAALLFLAACEDGDKDGKPSGDSGVKVYADSADGLKAYMTDLSAAANGGDAALATRMADGLIYKDAAGWFKKTFGDDKSDLLAAEYAAATKGGSAGLVDMLKAQKAKDRTEFLAERFTDASDPNACGYQQTAIESAKAPLTISSWRAVQPGKQTGQHLFNFVYVDGQWRFLGPLKMLKPEVAKDAKLNAVSSLRAKDREEFFKSGKLPE
jgi:hypothetical protein